MKKITSIFLLMLMLFACPCVSAYNPISVDVDANVLEFDVAPINKDGRVLVPVRAIFEALGATVEWNPQTLTVISTLDNKTISLSVDNIMMFVDNNIVMLDVPPILVSGRTLVPVRAVAEAFDTTVTWIGEENRVKITTSAGAIYDTEGMNTHTVSKFLTSDHLGTDVAYNISYFEGYDIKTNLADGTDFNILCSSDTFYADFSIRTDLYTGAAFELTPSHAQNLAEDIASLVHGTDYRGTVSTIRNRKFLDIRYSGIAASATLGGVNTDVIYYTTVDNGVMYTMTYISYGDVPEKISSDINYMMNTLIIK